VTVLSRIAFFQGKRDEGPNQVLARELAVAEDTAGIQEIAENLLQLPEMSISQAARIKKVIIRLG
jgi:hypothetical protein